MHVCAESTIKQQSTNQPTNISVSTCRTCKFTSATFRLCYASFAWTFPHRKQLTPACTLLYFSPGLC